MSPVPELIPGLMHTRQGLARGALATQGDAKEGVAHIRLGLAASYGVGPELMRPYWLSLLTEMYNQAGQPEAGRHWPYASQNESENSDLINATLILRETPGACPRRATSW